jgi:hypothetical protein
VLHFKISTPQGNGESPGALAAQQVGGRVAPLVNRIRRNPRAAYCPVVRVESANHDLFNPLAMSAVDAPNRDLPAASPYQFAVAVLEWSTGLVIILPPVAQLESPIFHRPHLSGYEQL